MLVLGVAILLAVATFSQVDRGDDSGGDATGAVVATPVLTASPQRTATDPADGGEAAGALLVRGEDGWRYAGAAELMVAVTLDRVIDGDTIDVRPFGGGVLRVRLIGVSAPERGERCADEATALLATLAGETMRLLPDQRLEDDFGRQLRYAFTAAGASIDAALIESGLATAWRADGALRAPLVAIEAEARDAGRGCLWSGG